MSELSSLQAGIEGNREGCATQDATLRAWCARIATHSHRLQRQTKLNSDSKLPASGGDYAEFVVQSKNGFATQEKACGAISSHDLENQMSSKKIDTDKLDKLVAEANRSAAQRELGYRERSLKMYPWVCGRCMREFTHANVSQLTVHHRDHNHNNNPPDGSNWELLCLYCHDNEHSRYLEADSGYIAEGQSQTKAATHNPFAALAGMMKKK